MKVWIFGLALSLSAAAAGQDLPDAALAGQAFEFPPDSLGRVREWSSEEGEGRSDWVCWSKEDAAYAGCDGLEGDGDPRLCKLEILECRSLYGEHVDVACVSALDPYALGSYAYADWADTPPKLTSVGELPSHWYYHGGRAPTLWRMAEKLGLPPEWFEAPEVFEIPLALGSETVHLSYENGDLGGIVMKNWWQPRNPRSGAPMVDAAPRHALRHDGWEGDKRKMLMWGGLGATWSSLIVEDSGPAATKPVKGGHLQRLLRALRPCEGDGQSRAPFGVIIGPFGP